ncbi:MAG: aldehyde dehydrogenase family protein [Deltaproteobacteria bacterium]|nr:aldehyde dehydrogenase family protein [Deltaproteobacteria bacterium]MCB9788773.1 aldehyde dehydrogenase family protein [Deltaproteobacteria bacterium]
MSTQSLTITNPWTGEPAFELPLDDPAAVDAKVRAARAAADRWASTTLDTRLALVERFIEVAGRERDTLALEISRQMGKPVAEARGEVGTMIGRARMMMALAPDALADRGGAQGDGIRRTLLKEPLGVVLDIAAWNYPLLIAVNVVVPAVLAGDAVLLKHASQTARVGLWFERAFAAAEAPAGLVTAVTVRGRDARGLVQHPLVDGVFFTGSTAAGRTVYQHVAQREQGFIDAGLELGGKDPAYVRADMPLDIAVPNLVEGAFYNAGQSCCAVERIYVHRSLYADFVDAYVEQARRWTIGDPTADGTLIGALATPETLETLDAQVSDAVAKGARLLLGGERPAGPGWRYPATVVADATHAMSLMTEESFGPVIGIAAVEDDAEALRLMNDTVYGLTASIWTADHHVGGALARRVRAGTVFVNRCDYVDPSLPWTGFGDSGKGVTLSALGFDQLTRARGLHVRPLSLMR